MVRRKELVIAVKVTYGLIIGAPPPSKAPTDRNWKSAALDGSLHEHR